MVTNERVVGPAWCSWEWYYIALQHHATEGGRKTKRNCNILCMHCIKSQRGLNCPYIHFTSRNMSVGSKIRSFRARARKEDWASRSFGRNKKWQALTWGGKFASLSPRHPTRHHQPEGNGRTFFKADLLCSNDLSHFFQRLHEFSYNTRSL